MSSRRRIKLVVAYDGSDFRGWAAQRGQRTVRGILTEAVRQVSGEDVEIIGASRTDSGAHAQGQVCHFDTEAGIPPERLPRVLGHVLPRDLAVLSAEHVPDRFHSRFWAAHRWYRYRIHTGPRDPLSSRYVFAYGRPLDVAPMREAAQMLVGRHDFLAFSQLVPPDTSTVREVLKVGVRARRAEVMIDVVATAYVRGMMRRIAGALWEVGRGRRTPEHIAWLLDPASVRAVHRPTVLPASGLCLMKVAYGRHPFDRRPERRGTSELQMEEQDEQDLYGKTEYD